MKMEIGELRRQLALDVQQGLERIINAKKDLDRRYHILVFARAREDNVIETKFVTMFPRPTELVGTMCYLVDNKTSQLWRLWNLPRDIPRPDDLIDMDSLHEATGVSAQRLGPVSVLNH
mgnify:CR=1 FL=1